MNKDRKKSVITEGKLFPELLISILLFTAVLVVYINVSQFDFTNYDDDIIVSQNINVKNGLTLDNITWAFHSVVASNWHPLTMLTHIMDFELFGMNAGGHHITNVLIHGMNSVLMFLVFFKMTGAKRRSAIVAALFAFHPLHVGAVAWIAERKEVLCAFFWLLTMWAYVDYTKNQSKKSYLMVIVFFVMGIMSKPMIVTLPCVLLLMDVWPLSRLSIFDREIFSKKSLIIVFEKVPLLALSASMAVLTFSAQDATGAVQTMTQMPLGVRVANAVAAYGEYVFKTFIPINLSILYPHPGMPPLWKLLPSIALIAFVTIYAIRFFKKQLYVLTGWLWFLGTLVPVIGLVQVGTQALADRYTYISITGIFIIAVWGAYEIIEKMKINKKVFTVGFAVILSAFALLSMKEILYWENSVTLFSRSVQVTENNHIAHLNLGAGLADEGKTDEAISHYRKAIEIKPDFADSYFNLGVEYQGKKAFDKALKYYFEAIKIEPEMTMAYNNIGMLYSKKGERKLALKYLHEGEKYDPNDEDINNNLGLAYMQKGDVQKAGQYYRRAINSNPYYAPAYFNIGAFLYANGKKDNARQMYLKALEVDPQYSKAARELEKIESDEN